TYKLFKAKDLKKDQSYFLYCLKKEDLPKILFPLGDFTKEKVRALALKINLPVAGKLDSQEICFIEKDYKNFLKEKFKDRIKKGKILNLEGKFLGTHKGLPFYTIGQRRGLEISAPAPLYVIKMDMENNTLIVGEDKALFKRKLTASEINWISKNFLLKVKSKIRYNMKEKEAQIFKENENKIKVVFSSAVRAITPGQAVVFYQGDEVLGGGVISGSDFKET
ncbi:MAG: tRNA 2-thiouridine(34) synthase MnmA, partial [Armatimonadetes bacterium]|nr:tRNA 2-thiouridine(34) synthase MnmA [Armatimonadota bacterium]